MDNDFIEIIFVIGAIVLAVVFLKYFLFILLGAAVLIGIFALASQMKKNKNRKEMVLEDVERGTIDDYIKQSSSQIQNLRRYYYKLKDEDIRISLDNVTEGLKKIIKILKEDPRDFKAVRRFMNLALESSDKILSQCAQLYSIENPNEKTKQGIKDAKEGLDVLSTAINNHINKLYDNNALDLDIEVKVLKKLLGTRGLLNENKENEDDQ